MVTDSSVFAARRARLSGILASRSGGGVGALVFAGAPRSRNYPAQHYPFRAESHFLYLVGRSIAGAAVLVHEGRSTLFVPNVAEDDALWHGEAESADTLQQVTGVDEVLPLSQAGARLALISRVSTLPTNDDLTGDVQASILGRKIRPRGGSQVRGVDAWLADAMIEMRLAQDEPGITQIRAACAITAKAHASAAKVIHPGVTEGRVRGAFLSKLAAHGLEVAYEPIVTGRGEVLHARPSNRTLVAGDLLLLDGGAESAEGWASDVTRVYPVSGTFSATQRAMYDVVLAAQRAAIETVAVGIRYREVHRKAAAKLLEGLVELKIFTCSVESLIERNAAALFFPHGVGHLMGLDVHDMEDLGDRAGYLRGRYRSPLFGERYLRLDRELQIGTVVTVEPGFYQVPGLFADERLMGPLQADLDRDELAKYADVRGIRLEDDVLVTAEGREVLTAAIPIEASDVERITGGVK